MLQIPEKESLTVEFKSDQKRLPDRELVAAAVCLANAEGGEIYLGVE
jgi:ATP-dependent DNA helicase RecG